MTRTEIARDVLTVIGAATVAVALASPLVVAAVRVAEARQRRALAGAR